MTWRLGFDIGGTFTDFVLQDVATGDVIVGKHLTTPHDPAEGARTFLVTTRGFRDVLEIQRQLRYNLNDFFVDKQVPLIPRNQIVEVDERLFADGTVLRPLDLASAREALRALAPGDAVVLNDLYMGSGHRPDFFLATPVFHRDRLVGFVVNCAHQVDVGGAAAGSQAVEGITEFYQEGIRILPTRLWRAGEVNREVMRLITGNVRVPGIVATIRS